jgi:hypothetical protein
LLDKVLPNTAEDAVAPRGLEGIAQTERDEIGRSREIMAKSELLMRSATSRISRSRRSSAVGLAPAWFRPTRLAADVHGRRHFGRVEVVRAMAAAEAIVGFLMVSRHIGIMMASEILISLALCE